MIRATLFSAVVASIIVLVLFGTYLLMPVFDRYVLDPMFDFIGSQINRLPRLARYALALWVYITVLLSIFGGVGRKKDAKRYDGERYHRNTDRRY